MSESPCPGARAGIYPASSSPSPFSTLVVHPHHPGAPSLSRAVRFFPPAEDVPAQAPIQPIVGPRLITTLPNVRPSYRGRVRHGGPRALTNSRDIPANERASERAHERANDRVESTGLGNPRGDIRVLRTCIHSPPRVPVAYPSIRRDSQCRFRTERYPSRIFPDFRTGAAVNIQSEREDDRRGRSRWRRDARLAAHRILYRRRDRGRYLGDRTGSDSAG